MRYKINIWASVLFFFYYIGSAQSDFSIVRINVLNATSRMPVRKVDIIIQGLNKKILTDKNGSAILALPNANYNLSVFHPEYQARVYPLRLKQDTTVELKIKRTATDVMLGTVEVRANAINEMRMAETGKVELFSPLLADLPKMGGEADILKLLSLQTGAALANEGNAELMIRGSTADQTMYVINGVRINRTSVLLGFLSVLDPLWFNKTTLYKSSFPVSYGGKIGAVVEAETGTPELNNFGARAEINPVAAKGLISIPIIKNKMAIRFYSRRSVADRWVGFVMPRNLTDNFSYLSFGSDGAYNINEKHKLRYFLFYDTDSTFIALNTTDENGSKNKSKVKAGSIRYLYENNNLYNTLLFGFSESESIKGTTQVLENKIGEETFSSSNRYIMLENILGLPFGKNTETMVGAQLTLWEYDALNFFDNFGQYPFRTEILPASNLTETALFGEITFRLAKWLTIELGLRNSTIFSSENNLSTLEPRTSVALTTGPNSSLKFDYSKTTQFNHKLSNTGLELPFVVELPYSVDFMPEQSEMYAAEFARVCQINSHIYKLKAEAYYKSNSNILHYQTGHNVYSIIANNTKLEQVLARGVGHSSGFGLSITKKTGRLSLMTSYSYSKTWWLFDKLNNGNQFLSDFDRPHSFSTSTNYKLPHNWSVGVVWQFSSGKPYTKIDGWATAPRFVAHRFYSGDLFWYFDELNNERTKPFHRLDVQISKEFSKKSTWIHRIGIAVTNVYNRNNPYAYYFRLDQVSMPDNRLGWSQQLYSVSLFPVIPSVSYSLRFGKAYKPISKNKNL